jgi:hypothetical protein
LPFPAPSSAMALRVFAQVFIAVSYFRLLFARGRAFRGRICHFGKCVEVEVRADKSDL